MVKTGEELAYGVMNKKMKKGQTKNARGEVGKSIGDTIVFYMTDSP